MRLILLALLLTTPAHAQWDLQHSGTTADLRGIASVGAGIAWASGSNGTVLRTEDGGYLWQRCTVPPGADKLDFRGIEAFDANTAIVMSSGKGDLSRLYKTTDGCQTWKLIATNPDKDGFWDAFAPYSDCCNPGDQELLILGDSVGAELRLWQWTEGWEERELELAYEAKGHALKDEGSFAASNSVLQIAKTTQVDKTWKYRFRWASGTASHAMISYVRVEETPTCEPCREEKTSVDVPMAGDSAAAGIFSLGFRTDLIGIAVGGNYEKPLSSERTAIVTSDGAQDWTASTTPPHGYRSAVAYDATTKSWLTVGPNGTDISTDDGRNWRALKPGPTEAPDADSHWNALSLPFVVGPHGRIGLLNPTALSATGAASSQPRAKP